ncbi:MAG: ABC transporter ATP-binding protein, partial [Clostridiales bacterium]|nr:ABC transporter ATP-binding protein [Clostridiales bacterium]
EKTYKDVKALRGLNLSIPKGIIYGLLGPNGAGKSTFINIMAGLVKADAGSLIVAEKELPGEISAVKGKMGFVPQDLAIYEDLNAYENISFFASLYGLKGKEKKEKVERALEFVSLTDRKKDLAKTYSGGMKRRLNLACGICHEPSILVLDEPTVGIDPQSRNHIMESIKLLNSNGMTVIYTTHYMEEAETLCDRIGIIDHGEILAEGTLEELQKTVSENELLLIEVSGNLEELSHRISTINGIIDSHIEDDGILVKHNGQKGILEAIVRHTAEIGSEIHKLESRMPNLEDVFLSMTGRTLRD